MASDLGAVQGAALQPAADNAHGLFFRSYFPRGLLDPEGLPPDRFAARGPAARGALAERLMARGPASNGLPPAGRSPKLLPGARGRSPSFEKLSLAKLGRSPNSLRGPRGRSPLPAPSLPRPCRRACKTRPLAALRPASPASARAPRKVLAAPVAPANLSERGPPCVRRKGFSRGPPSSPAPRESGGRCGCRAALGPLAPCSRARRRPCRPLRSSVASRSVRRRGPFSALARSPRKAETCLRGSGFSC